jgi:hypothetical protein
MHRTLHTLAPLGPRPSRAPTRRFRGVDYRTLNRYIIAIHQLRDIDSILSSGPVPEGDLGLPALRLAMAEGETMEVWLEPEFHHRSTALLAIARDELGAGGGECVVPPVRPTHQPCPRAPPDASPWNSSAATG